MPDAQASAEDFKLPWSVRRCNECERKGILGYCEALRDRDGNKVADARVMRRLMELEKTTTQRGDAHG